MSSGGASVLTSRMGLPGFNLEKVVGSTDSTDSTDWKPVERGCGFTRRVKWKRRSVEAPRSSPSVKSVKSVDNPTAVFSFRIPVSSPAAASNPESVRRNLAPPGAAPGRIRGKKRRWASLGWPTPALFWGGGMPQPYPCGRILTRSRGERGERGRSPTVQRRQPFTRR